MSVAEYEYSALLYLCNHEDVELSGDALSPGSEEDVRPECKCSTDFADGKADGSGTRIPLRARGSFSGGRLIFHDEDADRVVLPQRGLLVAFTSGASNLHAVEHVTSGSRFALTMWFTTRPEASSDAANDGASHIAMQQWAAEDFVKLTTNGALRDHRRPPPLPPCSSTLQSREDAIVSAALCSLPANDPLVRALLLSRSHGARKLAELLGLSVGLPSSGAHAAPRIDIDNLLNALAAGMDVDVLHPLLLPRTKVLHALLVTLRRAKMERDVFHGQAAVLADRQPDPSADFFSVFN